MRKQNLQYTQIPLPRFQAFKTKIFEFYFAFLVNLLAIFDDFFFQFRGHFKLESKLQLLEINKYLQNNQRKQRNFKFCYLFKRNQILKQNIFLVIKINVMQSKRNKSFENDIDLRLDEQFVKILTKIEANYLVFNRHTQIRIEKWVEKLLQCDENTIWRKSRNNYLALLCQMVVSQKITGMFLRMPPEKDLPNLAEGECRRLMQQLKLIQKTIPKNYQIMMKKIQQPCGDVASELTTPNCQTERIVQNERIKQIETNHTSNEHTGNKTYSRSQISYKSSKDIKLLAEKMLGILHRHQKTLRKDIQYNQLMQKLYQTFCLKSKTTAEEESSGELKVEEGIQINKANLFQFGSPRGMTQMQYFKAALQL